MGTSPSKIFTQQYTTAITDESHKQLTEAVNWLFETKRITKKSKYYVTRFALMNLVEFVNFKKAKGNGGVVQPNVTVSTTESTTQPVISPQLATSTQPLTSPQLDTSPELGTSTQPVTSPQPVDSKEPLKKEGKVNAT